MSVKHVQEYYDKVANDFVEMNRVLKELEENIPQDNVSNALSNIENIKQQVNALKENYLRISYIMYLLNMPQRKSRQHKYNKQNQRKLSIIPNKDTLDGILQENKEVLTNINSYLCNKK